MNNTRRKEVRELVKQLKSIGEQIEQLGRAESDAHSNLPESIANGSKGQEIERAMDYLGNAMHSINDVTDALNESIGDLL